MVGYFFFFVESNKNQREKYFFFFSDFNRVENGEKFQIAEAEEVEEENFRFNFKSVL